jgi:uncharacterized protein DUF6265
MRLVMVQTMALALAAPSLVCGAGTDVRIYIGPSGSNPCVWDSVFPTPAIVSGNSTGVDFKVCSNCSTCDTSQKQQYRVEIRDDFQAGFEMLPCKVDILVPAQIDVAIPCNISGDGNVRYRYKVTVCPASGSCAGGGDPEVWVRRETLIPPYWLEGRWVGERGGAVREEYWTRASDVLMLGSVRTTDSNGSITIELVRIEKSVDALTYSVTRDGRTTTLGFSRQGPRNVAFGGRVADGPQRMVRRLLEDGRLSLANGFLKAGSFVDETWELRRVAAPAP